MDFSAQRPEAIREISPIGCKTQALGSNFMNQPLASQKCAVFRGAHWCGTLSFLAIAHGLIGVLNELIFSLAHSIPVNQAHAFPALVRVLPEARQALNQLALWLNRQ